MVRARKEGRLPQIADAAIEAFTHTGLQRTQVVDVARSIGVSAGTLYLYVQNKEGLFALALARLLDELPGEDALPIPSPSMSELVERVAKGARRRAKWPTLTAAKAGKLEVSPLEEVRAVVDESFTLLAREERTIDLLETCAPEVPQLAKTFLVEIRGRFLEDFLGWVDRAARAGRLSPVGPPKPTARALVESLAFLAMQRPRAFDARGLDETTARETAHAIVQAGLRPAARKPRGRRA